MLLSPSLCGGSNLCTGSADFLLGFSRGRLFEGFKGELCFVLGLSLHRDGLLCMPFGGVKEVASGIDGGSSGSGYRSGRPVFGDRRCLLPQNESASSSPSGAGGGSGRGLGLKGDLIGMLGKTSSDCREDGSDPELNAAPFVPCAGSLVAGVGALAESRTASPTSFSLEDEVRCDPVGAGRALSRL